MHEIRLKLIKKVSFSRISCKFRDFPRGWRVRCLRGLPMQDATLIHFSNTFSLISLSFICIIGIKSNDAKMMGCEVVGLFFFHGNRKGQESIPSDQVECDTTQKNHPEKLPRNYPETTQKQDIDITPVLYRKAFEQAHSY